MEDLFSTKTAIFLTAALTVYCFFYLQHIVKLINIQIDREDHRREAVKSFPQADKEIAFFQNCIAELIADNSSATEYQGATVNLNNGSQEALEDIGRRALADKAWTYSPAYPEHEQCVPETAKELQMTPELVKLLLDYNIASRGLLRARYQRTVAYLRSLVAEREEFPDFTQAVTDLTTIDDYHFEREAWGAQRKRVVLKIHDYINKASA